MEGRRGRLRRAGTLVAYWREGNLIFENYLAGISITADPLTVQVLHAFDGWRRRASLARQMPLYTRRSLDVAVRQLTRRRLLLREGSREAREDARFVQRWSHWLPHAGLFHFATKDTTYRTSAVAVTRLLRRFLAEGPQPAFFKRYSSCRQIRLPPPGPPAGEFPRALLGRRTHRDFSPRPPSLDSLSRLLFYTWGLTGFLRDPLLGRLPLKTSPSGGARHPGEVYVLASRVQGLPAGLYHYAPQSHHLEQMRRGRMTEKAIRYCCGQRWVGRAAAVFLMTAVLPRVMWKYRAARAYRAVLVEAGHLCQTFCLVATWLGLAPFCTMALRDSLIEKDLGLGGINEIAVYVAGVGARRSRGAEPAVRRRRRRASR